MLETIQINRALHRHSQPSVRFKQKASEMHKIQHKLGRKKEEEKQ